MAFSALAAISAAVAATTGIAGTAISSNAAANANQQQQGIAKNATQNALNQQQYQQALNAEAMKRSIAGTTDGQGNSTTYDPATNTWKTNLSQQGQRSQTATDQANISRNTTDLATSQDANSKAMLDAIKARTAAGPALAAVENYKPLTSQGLEGDLQQTATTANRQAQQPIIADTLRQFARTGSAASPVLTTMMRDNATSLRQTMLQDSIAAKENVGKINAQNLGSLDANYQTLNGAAKPSLGFSPIVSTGPNDALLSAMAQRANGAAQPASMGAYASTGATNGFNGASQLGTTYPNLGSGLGSQVIGVGDALTNLMKSGGAVSKWLNNGSGNAGDTPASTYQSSYGYSSANDRTANNGLVFGGV